MTSIYPKPRDTGEWCRPQIFESEVTSSCIRGGEPLVFRIMFLEIAVESRMLESLPSFFHVWCPFFTLCLDCAGGVLSWVHAVVISMGPP